MSRKIGNIRIAQEEVPINNSCKKKCKKKEKCLVRYRCDENVNNWGKVSC